MTDSSSKICINIFGFGQRYQDFCGQIIWLFLLKPNCPLQESRIKAVRWEKHPNQRETNKYVVKIKFLIFSDEGNQSSSYQKKKWKVKSFGLDEKSFRCKQVARLKRKLSTKVKVFDTHVGKQIIIDCICWRNQLSRNNGIRDACSTADIFIHFHPLSYPSFAPFFVLRHVFYTFCDLSESYWISLRRLLFKNIAHGGSFQHCTWL